MKQGDEKGEQILFHLFSYSGAYPSSFPELLSAAMSWIQINVIPKLSVVNIIIPKRYSWQLTVWEKQKIIQALQYNSITVSINHIFALGSENVTRITWMTRIFICKFPPFLISHRCSGAAKTEWKLGFTLLSRVRISQGKSQKFIIHGTHGEHGKD